MGKVLMDMDNSVVIVEEEGWRWKRDKWQWGKAIKRSKMKKQKIINTQKNNLVHKVSFPK